MKNEGLGQARPFFHVNRQFQHSFHHFCNSFCNPSFTHVAIWAARVMLLQRREPRKIMLILTDGCPDSGPDTKSATKRAMKDGIEIAAIGIMDGNVRNFWDNHKIIESVQELPAAMFGIMEGLLVKKTKAIGRGYAV